MGGRGVSCCARQVKLRYAIIRGEMKARWRVWAGAAVVAAVAAIMWRFNDTRQDKRTPHCEKVVEFTYSRTQPCNSEYYNYGFSIGPLQDRIMCWSGSKGASQLDFRTKVMMQVKTFPEVSELRMTDEIIMEAISHVEFSIVKDVQFVHPIKCRMIVRGVDKRVVGLVALAFARAMIDDLELENKSISWKATMDKGCVCKRRERELAQLRKRISDKALSIETQHELKVEINNVERSLHEAKSLWDESIKAYREKWDASIVFLDEPKP